MKQLAAWLRFSSVLCRVSHAGIYTSNLGYYFQHNLLFLRAIKAKTKLPMGDYGLDRVIKVYFSRWQKLCSSWSWRLATRTFVHRLVIMDKAIKVYFSHWQEPCCSWIWRLAARPVAIGWRKNALVFVLA